ncbi:MAG: hypothetical protein H0T73_10760 [Ardenticatenales bacterium]|nr:hypothetical protein [Ardenticatenales bacterium]
MNGFPEFFASLSMLQLGVGIAITAGVVAIVMDWRLALFGVLIQYLLVSLLLDTELPTGLAMVKLVAGSVSCLTLYWTARRIEFALDQMEDGRRWFNSNRDIYPMGLPFRFLALIFTALLLFTLPDRFSLTAFPRIFLIPSFWLLAMGLLTIILTRDPLKTGMGLLTFQNGFELLYTLAEPGLLVLGLLGIGTILVGLVASYLAVARHLPLIEARQATGEAVDPHSPEALQQAVEALNQGTTSGATELSVAEEIPT